MGITCDTDGNVIIDKFRDDLSKHDTTVGLLGAEGWKLLCHALKAALLTGLSKTPGLKRLLEVIVKFWATAQAQAGNSNCPNVQAQSFDFIVEAYEFFTNHPDKFDMTVDDHRRLSVQLGKAILYAFRVELDDVNTNKSYTSYEGHAEAAYSSTPSASGSNSTADGWEQELHGLMRESKAALNIRQIRNSQSAHPFQAADPQMFEKLVKLYEQAVQLGHYNDFPRLARASLMHVKGLVAKAIKESPGMGAAQVQMGDLCMEEFTLL
eukprot:CAMPEP_0202890978 /NCGR_PEP_ID=MMETSP1392-20130828/1196_1 /ASSEMBLY_ACC=CAM_ASM_000868 /TAXON_ID=225041 /ORGANISM="Chlamydomonas chlamydogama, Strain SAG 11-48b" /LENGTH=265 /DNA_ID=CAMNT_0049574637 /DNA_START=263 /DNA_END=1060 /DNA_ORIENTATION=+